ncbi:MAG: Gldg family protein [Candidatus Glassbacteria bacterium]|nr:Gldg family protein [Candidatus Glassbacteria bacterium]
MATKKFILFILGIVLVLAAAILQRVQAASWLLQAAFYLPGAASLTAYAWINRQELVLLFGRRSTRHGMVSAVYILIFVGILVLVGLFSRKHHHRWDLTKNKTHSVSLETRQQLERLDRDTLDLMLYAFYRGDSELRDKEQFTDLLETYSLYSERFKYKLTDLDRNPLLALQLGITSTSTVILTYGENQEKIYSEQEAKITNAISKLLGSDTPGMQGAVYFVTGHGEPKLEAGFGEEEELSYSEAKAAIEERIGPVRELLTTGKPVPDSCEILVVAGPRVDYQPAELESIAAYLDRGGRALFLIDPFLADSMAGFLGRYGIDLGRDLVVDLMNATIISPFVFIANSYEPHEITKFFDVATMFGMARSVRADSTPPPGVEVKEFIKTSQMSYAETDLELIQYQPEAVFHKAQDEGAEVPLAVAATIDLDSFAPAAGEQSDSAAAAREARIVVIGDRDFIADGLLGKYGNRDLLLNCLRWLRGQADQITIAAKESENTPLILKDTQRTVILMVTLVALPGLVVLCGIFVRVRRRARR